MRIDAAIDALGTLRTLAARGDALSAHAADELVGAAGRGAREQLVAAAVDDGDAAVRALGEMGAFPSVVGDVRRAVALLGGADTAMALRATGRDVAATARRAMRSIDDSATDVELRRALAADVFAGEVTLTHPDDWSRLQGMLARDHARVALDGPRELPDAPTLSALAGAAASGTIPDDLHRYVRAWRAHAVDPAARREEAAGLVLRDPATLRPDDWNRFAALLDADLAGTVLTGPRTIDSARPLRSIVADVASGEQAVDEQLHRYFEAWRAHTATPEQLTARADELFARDPESLQPGEWRELRAMLERDPDGSVLDGPRDLRGAAPLATALRDLGGGSTKVPNVLDRYFEAWRLRGAPEDTIIGTARALLARTPDSLSRREWARLAAAFDADVRGALPAVGPDAVGDVPRGKFLADLTTGERKSFGEMGPWFGAMRRAFDPGHETHVASSIDALAAGTGRADDAALVAGESLQLVTLLKERTPIERLRVAEALLEVESNAASRGVRQTLKVLRYALRELPDPPAQLQQQVEESLELANRNLQRLDGQIANPTSPGMARFPDYGEIGRLRANLELINRTIGRHGDAGPAAQAPAPSTVEASGAAESLTW